MPVADRFFPRRSGVDRVEGKDNFDEFAMSSHSLQLSMNSANR
jgi:hypothetical protein